MIDTGNIIKETFRDSDIVGRIGGDEFAALAIEVGKPHSHILATRLQHKVKAFNLKGDRRYKLSVSIGAVCCDPECLCPIDELLARADAQMYEEKRGKKGHRSG